MNASVRSLLGAEPWAAGSIPEHRGVLAVTVVGFLLRVLHWQLTAVMFNDGPTFIGIAKRIVAGDPSGAFAQPQHPLYPLFIALLHTLIPNWEQAAAWVCIAGGTLCIPVLYVFFRDAFGPRIALLGALLYATQPHAVRYTADAQSEGLYFLFFFAAIALLWKAVAHEKFRFAALAGVLAGCAYLTRPEGVGVVFVALGLALSQVLLRRWRLPWAVGWAGAVVLAAGLVMSPYLSAIHESDGVWRLTRKKSVVEVIKRSRESSVSRADLRARQQPPSSARTKPSQKNPPPVEPAPHPSKAALSEKRLDAQRQIILPSPHQRSESNFDPGSISDGVADIAERFWSRFPAEIVLFLLGCPFIFGRAREPASEVGWGRFAMGLRGRFMVTVLGFYLALLLFLRLEWGYISGRHVFTMGTLCSGYAVLGIPVLGAGLHKLGERLFRRDLSVRPLAIGLAVVLCFSLVQEVSPYRAKNMAERRAAEWFQAWGQAEGEIITSRLRVAYYAGAPFISLRALSRRRNVMAFLSWKRVRYLLIEDDQVAKFDFVGELFRADQLRALHCEEARGRRACVYEYTGGAGKSHGLRSGTSN